MAKTKILIVDDDLTLRNIYAEIFRRNDFDVLEASDGVDGLDIATKELPDIIFTGIIMPRMDGFSLKEALAKNVSTANIPVVMNSHMGREEDRTRAMALGVKDFIIQGMVTPKEVVEKMKVMLGNSAKGYKIRLNSSELDAQELASDLDFNSNFLCKNCASDLILEMVIKDVRSHEFAGKIICPNCGEI